jgi:hypothetical protein
MDEVLVKFQGGQCNATSCGSKNSIAAMMATAMLQEMNTFNVAQAQSQDVQAQVAGLKLGNSGIQLG